LKKNKTRLDDKIFYESYGSLYENLKVSNKSNTGNIYWLVLFMFKRLILIIITIWFNWFPWFQISIYQWCQLIALSQLLHYKPMISPFLNVMETINEIFVLVTGYFLFLFTDLVPDVADRYMVGNIFKDLFFVAVCIDGILIFIIIGLDGWKYFK